MATLNDLMNEVAAANAQVLAAAEKKPRRTAVEAAKARLEAAESKARKKEVERALRATEAAYMCVSMLSASDDVDEADMAMRTALQRLREELSK